jgi:hypothetical protein
MCKTVLALTALSLLFCTGSFALNVFDLGEMFGLFRRAPRKSETTSVNQLFSGSQMWSQILCSTLTGQMAAPKPSRKGDGAMCAAFVWELT